MGEYDDRAPLVTDAGFRTTGHTQPAAGSPFAATVQATY
jgi:hypothetical protein